MAQLVPVDNDPFADASYRDDGVARPRVSVGGPKLVPVDNDPFANQPPSVAGDMLRSVPSGLAKGAIDLVGLPDTISKLWAAAGDKTLDAMESVLGLPKGWAAETKGFIQQGRAAAPMAGLPSAAGIRKGVEGVTGPLYDPQTVPGKFTGQIAEMVPGAGRRLITQALMPGVAAEGAGQAAERFAPDYAPVARGVGAVAGGVAGLPFARPSTADAAIRGGMGQLDAATIQRATALVDDAAARGVTLTWAEAIEQVAPGTGLTGLQRVVESTREGRNVMAPVMAQRPDQIDTAARQTFDTIAPVNPNPSGIGPAVGAAADETIGAVRGAINNATRPMYTAAQQIRLAPSEYARAQALPGYEQARAAVLNDPQLARYVQGLPEDSVGFLDEVRKQMNAARDAATMPASTNPNVQIPAGWGMDADAARQLGVDASRRVPGNPYETALAAQATLRQQYLEPLLNGPLGKLAQRDQPTRRAIEALFPAQPLPNSQQEIATAVRAVAQRNPQAANDLIRAYAESVFDQAAKQIQSGPSAYGGASFAAALSGQKRENLRAAIEATANGAQVWRGFERLLEIAEATGKRMREGSPTAGRLTEMKDLSTGSLAGNAAKLGASPGKWVSAVSDAWSRWQLGRNVDEIARILVDPGARNRLRAIATAPEGSERGLILAAQLTRMFSQGALNAGGEPNAAR
jgi:hypothetical protein